MNNASAPKADARTLFTRNPNLVFSKIMIGTFKSFLPNTAAEISYIMSMVNEVMAQDTTIMSMAFQSSLRYEPGWRMRP